MNYDLSQLPTLKDYDSKEELPLCPILYVDDEFCGFYCPLEKYESSLGTEKGENIDVTTIAYYFNEARKVILQVTDWSSGTYYFLK